MRQGAFQKLGPSDSKQWGEFATSMFYSPGDYANQEAYVQLAKRLAELESSKNLGGNRLIYLSTPPEVYPEYRRTAWSRWTRSPRFAGFRGAHHHRETVRPRPRIRERIEPSRSQCLREEAGVPHRSLPGQGYVHSLVRDPSAWPQTYKLPFCVIPHCADVNPRTSFGSVKLFVVRDPDSRAIGIDQR